MKIALIIQRPQPRGQEIFASLLGNWLISQGHEVLLLSLYEGDFPLPFQGKHYSLNWKSGSFWKTPSRLYRLSKTLKAFDPEIIQANGGDTLKFTVLARLTFSFSGKLIFNNGGVVGYYLRSAWQKRFYQFLLRGLDGIICISKYSELDIQSLIKLSVPQIWIPIGLETDRIYSLADPTLHPVFVHIGGFTPEKNHAFLLELFEKYRTQNPKSQLWLIGEGPDKKQIERKAAGMGGSNIRFFGAYEDPWSIVPENAILLLPSKIEGMPSVIAEAFLAKIPVIAAPVGGIPEMVEGFPTCTLADLEDLGEWMEAMEFWCTISVEERANRCERSHLIAKKKFGLSEVGKAFLGFYKIV